MDTEVLRKQIAEEVQAEFELQLRDMRRQKNRVEEEFENAAERWRAEKRRMSDEIERLETELEAGGRSPVTENVGKAHEDVEDKVRQMAEWQAERERLITQISRLQASVAEAIERSNNPIRATQTIRDQFEAKLTDLNTQRLEIEQQLLRGKATWEDEKKTLVNELIKVRRLTPPNILEVKEKFEKMRGRSETVEEVRIRELEGQLTEARSTILKYHENSMRSAQELATTSKETQALRRSVSEMKEQFRSEEIAQIRREYEAKIQELVKDNLKLEQQIGSGRTQGSGPAKSPSAASNSVAEGAIDLTAINAEVERVERAIAAIETLIDDPSTSASTMNQKNAEKAELDAYLRGMLFSLGRGKR